MNKKRKVTKRIAAWFLCLAMVLTTINLPAFSVDVKAAETVTVTSSITIDGNEYALYTGFTATAGIETSERNHHSNMVDGDISTKWTDVKSDEALSLGYTYLEFSSDVPIILKGYILNSYHDRNYHPSEWRLFAKADETDEYEEVSSYSNTTYSGTENTYPVVNEENNQYRFFRFECTSSTQVIWMTEIRLYGENELTYGFMPEKSATCTATGIKQDCYLRSDGKYFTDETGAEELSNEDVIAPIKPHNFYKEDGSHTAACIVCGAPNDNLEVHDFSDSDGNPLIECICGKHNPFYGYCGDPEVNEGKDVTWRVTQEEDGYYTMTISGTGEMEGHDFIADIPWWKYGIGNYQKKITRFIVSEGVTSVGQNACFEFEGLKYIELSNSVTYINYGSFANCTSLEYIKIPSSVTTIAFWAFDECLALTKVEIPCTLEFSSSWNVDESKVEKYHVFEKQPFIDGEDGTHYQNCKCGNITSTPESHAFTVEDVTIDGANVSGATCTEKAKYYKSCVCGVLSTSEVFEVGEPLGHSWGEYHLDGDQTCTDDGHKTARCTRVGCTETHTIEATGDALGTAYGAVGVYNDYSKAIIDGTSETSVLLPWDIEVAAVELNRTFTAGTFSTITLPFSMSVENVEGAVFYKFMYVSSDDGTVHIEPVRGELIANTPYLVKTTGETISFKAGTTLKRTLDATPMDKGQDEGDGWELRGNYGKMVWREGHPDLGHIYYIDDAGKLKKIEADDELGPMQAYIYFNGDISDIPCSVTGIHDFSNDTCQGICTVCGVTNIKGNHDFSESAYQYDNDGKHYQICALCTGESTHEECIPGETVKEDIVAPTCGEAGSHKDVVYCTKCNHKISSTPVTDPATGEHTFTKYVSNADGTHKVVCKDCGTVQEGHDKDTCLGGTATCTTKAKCSKCKAEYGSLKAHTNTTTITKATTSKDGSKVTKCSVCGRVASTTTIAMANTFTLAKTSYEYTGSQIKPAITVKDKNGTTIAATNYTVTYGANKAVGKGTVKVTFKGNYSGSKDLSFKIVPKKTTIGAPVIASDGITVKWTKNTTGAGYYIYRSVNGAAYTKVKTIESNATVSWKDTTAKTNGNKYQYKIVAYKIVSGATYTSAASAIKTIYFLTRPTVTLTNTATGVKVAWGKNAKATGYYVYRSTDGGKTYKNIKTITSNATVSFTDTAAKTNGTKYMYKVVAYKTVSSITYKSIASAAKTYYFISKPAISSLTNSAAGKMLIKWARNAKATGYQIQYSTSSDFSGAKTVTATGTTTTLSKTIGSLTKGKTYYVRIRSYKTVGTTKYYSAWSDKKSVKIVK